MVVWQIQRFFIVMLLISGASALLTSCAASSSNTPKLMLWEHQLVDRIWDVQQKVFIDQGTLVSRVLDSEYLLLGERHDNRVHHHYQTWVISQLAEAERQASVAFEMIDNYQGARIARQEIKSVDQLISVLNLSKTGWKYEQRYKSLFSEVMTAGYRIDSANLHRKRLMHTVMAGEEKLPAIYKDMLEQAPLSAEQMDILQEEINQSHCHMLDEKTARKMTLGQRVRDVIMAQSLLNSEEPTKVLIAGNGHVLNDRAVPMYLRKNLARQAKDPTILTIGFIEVEADIVDVQAYAKRWGSDKLPFDMVWFTPQVKRQTNQCDELRKHFKHIKKKNN